MQDLQVFDMHGQKITVDVKRDHPWHTEDPRRRKRWSRFFEGDRSLDKDPYLDAMGVGTRERKRRRWMTEHLMDTTVQEAAKNITTLVRGGYLTEQVNLTTNFATFTTWATSLIRQIWPRQFMNEVMGMQSMSQPTGRAFTLDHQYASAGGAYALGTSIFTSPDPTYSDDQGEGVEPLKLRMVITGETITVDSKKLISDYSIEAVQNLMAYHGLALEPEQMRMLGLEIIRERNREAIDGMVSDATTNTNWPATQPAVGGWATATPKEYQEELFDAVTDANEEIFTRIYRNANRIICGATFASRIEKLNRFRGRTQAEGYEMDIGEGPNLLGTLANRYKVFVDPDFATDQAMLVHKSNDWKYVGAVHMVFVPLWVSPTIPATTFTFDKGIMNRATNFYKNGNFQSTVTVT